MTLIKDVSLSILHEEDDTLLMAELRFGVGVVGCLDTSRQATGAGVIREIQRALGNGIVQKRVFCCGEVPGDVRSCSREC